MEIITDLLKLNMLVSIFLQVFALAAALWGKKKNSHSLES
jgi:hypothetical protein